MFSPVFRIQGNNIVPATKSIIETHIAKNDIRIIEIIINKATKYSTTQQKQC